MAFCIVWIKSILDKTNLIKDHLWITGFRIISGALTLLILSIILIPKAEIIKLYQINLFISFSIIIISFRSRSKLLIAVDDEMFII